MRLIEKECPNCGAGLKFNEDDKNCRCEYCKREFEIVRDTNHNKALAEQFNLNALKAPLKVFSIFTLGSFAVQLIFPLIALLMIGIIGFATAMSFNNNDNFFKDDTVVIKRIRDLERSDDSTIDLYSTILIRKNDTGTSDFSIKGAPAREKVYLLTKGDTNRLIVVYKVTYENILDRVTYEIFVPVQYKDVTRKHNSIAYSLGEGEILAKEYYFNLDHSEYAYGYQEMDNLYANVIEPLKEEYDVEEE